MAVIHVSGKLTEGELKTLAALLSDELIDIAIPVDAADPRVQFVVHGWFVVPRGGLTKPHDIEHPA